jgi:chemotaxis response regulator CheB
MKQAGATVIAQDRGSSEWFAMPAAALAIGPVDLCLPINQIGASLVALTTMPRAAKLFQTSLPIGRQQTAELN